MNRRLKRTVCFVLALALFACSPSDPDAGSTTTSSEAPGTTTTAPDATSTTEGAPAATELKVIRSDAAIDVLDPHATSRFSSRTVLAHIYDALIGRNPETMELEPELATEWQWLSDTELELTLRDDVTFTNGETLDAEVVVWNFERQRNPDTGPNLARRLEAVESVEATGDYTILISLTGPEPGLLDILTRLQVIPMEYGMSADETQIATEPIGSGRYTLEDWDTATSTVTLVRNDDYWGTPGVYETITIRWLSEAATIQSELLSEGADIVDAISVDAFELVENSGVARIESVPILQSNDCMLDALGRSGENPFQVKEVRQAVNMAVDWDAILETFYGNRAIRLATPVNPFQWGYDPSIEPYPYDPDEALRLLEDAGYGSGFDMTFYWFGSETNRRLTEVIAEYWRAIGINASLENIPDAQIGPTIQDGNAGPAMCLRSSTHVGIFDAGYAWGFFSGSALAYAGTEEFQAMIEAANSEVQDEDRRRQLLSELQQYAKDEALALYGYAAEAIRGVSNRVDWTPSADGLDRYYLAQPSS